MARNQAAESSQIFSRRAAMSYGCGLRGGLLRSMPMVMVIMLVSSCGSKEPEKPNKASIAFEKSVASEGDGPAAPNTEISVIEAVAVAISARDIRMMKALVSPELAADLNRLQRNDPDRFWKNGERLVTNTKSGVSICHRQELTKKRWRILLCFGNGSKERMTFIRREGRLLLEGL